MGLNTAASISFSQINSTSYFTNGNLGINTTNPTANLDVAGTINASGLSSLASITTGALSATNVSTGGLNATGLSALANATATNVSTGGLNATGLSALVNATATNVSAGVVIASTGLTTGTINASGTSVLSNVTATNVSTGSLNASTGITVASAQISNENVTTSTIATLRVSSNLLALGNSNTMGSIFTTGGNVGINTATPGSALHVAGPIAITPAGAGVHMGIDLNTFASIQLNSTIGSYIDFATGGIDYSTRIISYSTGNLSISNLADTCNVGINNASPSANLDVVGTIKVSGLSALANVTATNVSTGTLIATTSVTSGLLSATNVVGTSISAGTLSATTITGANLSLSGNLNVAGTLTTVNITSTNMLNTNISAGTINATGFTSLQDVTLTNVSAATIQASATNNTVYTPTCAFANNSTGGGSAVASFLTPNMTNDSLSYPLYLGKTLGTGNTATVSYKYVGANNSTNYIGLEHYGLAAGFYLLNNGNVGVGTASPNAQLQLSNTVANRKIVLYESQNNDHEYFGLGVNDGLLRYQTGGPAASHDFYAGITGTTSRHLMRIRADGFVGIGTTSPNALLDVRGDIVIPAGNKITILPADNFIYSGNNVGHYSLSWIVDPAATDFGAMSYLSGYGGIRLFTTGAPRLNILSNGNVGINNVNPAYTLDVSGTGRFTSNLAVLGNVGIGTTSPSGMLHLNNAALFTSTGNLTCTGDVVSFGSLSDRRLKKNIETIRTEKALDIVSKLRAVSFDWKEDIFNEEKRNTSDLGFIAQEVEELIPEAVSEYTQIESGEVYKNIKHERLVPYLLSAIQYLLSKQT